jgi:beta-galactosidase GanA
VVTIRRRAVGQIWLSSDVDPFIKDDKSWFYFSGGFHYWRELPELWEDRIMKIALHGIFTSLVAVNTFGTVTRT